MFKPKLTLEIIAQIQEGDLIQKLDYSYYEEWAESLRSADQRAFDQHVADLKPGSDKEYKNGWLYGGSLDPIVTALREAGLLTD